MMPRSFCWVKSGPAAESSVGSINGMPPNNRINSDWQFRCAPLPAGYAFRQLMYYYPMREYCEVDFL